MARKSRREPLSPLSEQEKVISVKLKDHVSMLAGTIGARSLTSCPLGLEKAAKYIEQIFSEFDYVRSQQDFMVDVPNVAAANGTADGISTNSRRLCTRNIIAEVQGGITPKEIIVLGAHYDSVYDCPAANDNGSGVAALLELSRLFKEIPPEISLRFVAFVNEEPPFFYWDTMGSMVYAKAARERGDPIRFMISLETIGCYRNQKGSQTYPPLLKYFYPDTGNFITFVSNLRSRRSMRDCVRVFASVTDFPVQSIATLAIVPGVSWSDHLAFWRHGYKAFMITDTAFYRYPYYHTAQDTPDKLNYVPFAEMTNGLFLMLSRLTKMEKHYP